MRKKGKERKNGKRERKIDTSCLCRAEIACCCCRWCYMQLRYCRPLRSDFRRLLASSTEYLQPTIDITFAVRKFAGLNTQFRTETKHSATFFTSRYRISPWRTHTGWCIARLIRLSWTMCLLSAKLRWYWSVLKSYHISQFKRQYFDYFF